MIELHAFTCRSDIRHRRSDMMSEGPSYLHRHGNQFHKHPFYFCHNSIYISALTLLTTSLQRCRGAGFSHRHDRCCWHSFTKSFFRTEINLWTLFCFSDGSAGLHFLSRGFSCCPDEPDLRKCGIFAAWIKFVFRISQQLLAGRIYRLNWSWNVWIWW